jgi:hypothetical protein
VGTGKRLALLMASPLLPGLMLYRILVRATKCRLLFPLLKSAPFLLLFVLAWAVGESNGYLAALVERPKSKQPA